MTAPAALTRSARRRRPLAPPRPAPSTATATCVALELMGAAPAPASQRPAPRPPSIHRRCTATVRDPRRSKRTNGPVASRTLPPSRWRRRTRTLPLAGSAAARSSCFPMPSSANSETARRRCPSPPSHKPQQRSRSIPSYNSINLRKHRTTSVAARMCGFHGDLQVFEKVSRTVVGRRLRARRVADLHPALQKSTLRPSSVDQFGREPRQRR
jgi:hypothetical protein